MTFEQLVTQGNQCIENQQPRQAIPYFMQVLQADPKHVAAISGLAKATLQLNDIDNAWQMLQMALALAPDDPDVLNAAGYARLAFGDSEGAVEKFEAALANRQDDPGILLNLASALCGTGDNERAGEIYQRLESEGRADATSRYNHSLLLLLQGRLTEAWPGFELRGQATNTGLRQRELPGQLWDGSAQPKDSLLIHAEQGLGDNIQFIRYVALISDRVGRVVVEAPKALFDLFASVVGIDELIPQGDEIPFCEWHASVMSLPALCATSEDRIPAEVPYLAVETAAVERWHQKIGQGDGRLHVGLVWAGNPGHRRDRERSISLRTLVPALAAQQGIAFHAFQIGEPLEQARDIAGAPEINILFPEPQPFTEVAAALSAVDLLVSVDTALAHLAGALGLPVWTLISRIPDWRWMLDRPDTPWYPSMRLFRQPVPGDWDTVAKSVGEALAKDAPRRG
ncbi:MAG: tetratricopeptide repeat protein [Rhodospirillales bacterium]